VFGKQDEKFVERWNAVSFFVPECVCVWHESDVFVFRTSLDGARVCEGEWELRKVK
jgi:hypothetical protein